MKYKILENLEHYKNTLARKERLIKPLVDKKNSIAVVLGDEIWTVKDVEEYTRLYCEISMLKEHISDLEYILNTN